MKILAIDTSTKFLCLGIFDQGKFYGYNLKVERKLSDLLAVTVARVLKALNIKIQEIDYFACGLGPGSFTGIRIGMAAVKGFSIVENKPVAGIPSLDVLAANVPPEEKRLIIPAVDARRGLIYCSSYKNERNNLKRKSPYCLLSLDEFLKKFKASKPVILGDALAVYGDKILNGIKGATLLDKDQSLLSAFSLMNLTLSKIKAKQLTSALSIKPIYLYPKECQIKTK